MFFKNKANQAIGYCLISRVDGQGDPTASPSAWVVKDGGAVAPGAGVISNKGNGQFSYKPTAGESDADELSVILVAEGCVPQEKTVYPFDPAKLVGEVKPHNGTGASTIIGKAIGLDVNGLAVYASAAAAGALAIGMMRAVVANNEPAPTVTSGTFTLDDWTATIGASLLIPGTVYYLSATAGLLTDIPPAAPGDRVQRIGTAISTTTLWIDRAEITSSGGGGITGSGTAGVVPVFTAPTVVGNSQLSELGFAVVVGNGTEASALFVDAVDDTGYLAVQNPAGGAFLAGPNFINAGRWGLYDLGTFLPMLERDYTTGELFLGAAGLFTTFPAGSAPAASFNVPHGLPPDAPVDGDVWTDALGFYAQLDGATVNLANGTPGGAEGDVQLNDGADGLAGSSDLTTDSAVYPLVDGLAIRRESDTLVPALGMWRAATGGGYLPDGSVIGSVLWASPPTGGGINTVVHLKTFWDASTQDGRLQVIVGEGGLLPVVIDVYGNKLGFHAATPVAQQTVSGSRSANAALASLCTALATLGLIVDGTSA